MADLISIICPVFNAEAFIADAIESVLAQKHENFEMLLVDDGSTDRSAEIIRSYTDSRLKYIPLDVNRGVSTARNRALDDMKGDFFCFLDADDRLTEQSLSSRLAVFHNNRETCFVDGIISVYNSDFTRILKRHIPDFSGNPLQALVRLDSRVFFGPTWMIRTKHIQGRRFLDGMTHGEELLFYIHNSVKGNFEFVNQETYQYRRHGASAMKNIEGLEVGYARLIESVGEMISLMPEDKIYLRKRVRRIMFLSYLKNGNVYAAMRSWMRFSKR